MTTEGPKTAQFDASFDSGVAKIKREFVFKDAHISFDVALPIKDEITTITVAQLHQRSVRRVIELLQGLVPPEK